MSCAFAGSERILCRPTPANPRHIASGMAAIFNFNVAEMALETARNHKGAAVRRHNRWLRLASLAHFHKTKLTLAHLCALLMGEIGWRH